MLTTLSATTADMSGHVEIDAAPATAESGIGRRVSRVATLDGGAVVNDAGYSDADRTIDLVWQPVSEAAEASIVRLLRLYGRLHVATRSGFYLAAPETYTPGAQESSLRLLILEKLSA